MGLFVWTSILIALSSIVPRWADFPISPRNAPYIDTGMNTHQIYSVGQDLGRNHQRFIYVGDSNALSRSFLKGLDMVEAQSHIDLGDYQYLQTVIEHFAGSYDQSGEAAKVGFNSGSALDSLFADDELCKPNETPLQCDIRLENPAFALISVGTNDAAYITNQQFHTAVENILITCIAEGVVPVLSTFSTHPAADGFVLAQQHNDTLVHLATAYGIPIIDVRAAVWNLPNHGIGTDEIHYAATGYSLDFAHQRLFKFGQTARNNLTLEALLAILLDVGALNSD